MRLGLRTAQIDQTFVRVILPFVMSIWPLDSNTRFDSFDGQSGLAGSMAILGTRRAFQAH